MQTDKEVCSCERQVPQFHRREKAGWGDMLAEYSSLCYVTTSPGPVDPYQGHLVLLHTVHIVGVPISNGRLYFKLPTCYRHVTP